MKQNLIHFFTSIVLVFFIGYNPAEAKSKDMGYFEPMTDKQGNLIEPKKPRPRFSDTDAGRDSLVHDNFSMATRDLKKCKTDPNFLESNFEEGSQYRHHLKGGYLGYCSAGTTGYCETAAELIKCVEKHRRAYDNPRNSSTPVQPTDHGRTRTGAANQ